MGTQFCQAIVKDICGCFFFRKIHEDVGLIISLSEEGVKDK